MQTKAITLALLTLTPAVLTSPTSIPPIVRALDAAIPGTQAGFAAMLEKKTAVTKRGVNKRCLYDEFGDDKCVECQKPCSKENNSVSAIVLENVRIANVLFLVWCYSWITRGSSWMLALLLYRWLLLVRKLSHLIFRSGSNVLSLVCKLCTNFFLGWGNAFVYV